MSVWIYKNNAKSLVEPKSLQTALNNGWSTTPPTRKGRIPEVEKLKAELDARAGIVDRGVNMRAEDAQPTG